MSWVLNAAVVPHVDDDAVLRTSSSHRMMKIRECAQSDVEVILYMDDGDADADADAVDIFLVFEESEA